MIDLTGLTFGCEHEWADWDQRNPLPHGFGIDRRDTTMVNSNGIAVDPTGRHHHRGGEVNTRPTSNPYDQSVLMSQLLQGPCRDAVVNYRSNLHVHVRVPGLRDDLPALKKLAFFNQRFLKRILPLVEPIPRPNVNEFLGNAEEFIGAMRRYRRRLRSHHTTLPEARVNRQLTALTLQEFFEGEVPAKDDGVPLWYCQPRAAVNVRQLRETDTVEFRHFPGTLDAGELDTCVSWCRDWMIMALDWAPGYDPIRFYQTTYAHRGWPKFPSYVHWMEQRYRLTVLDGSIPRDLAIRNIAAILEGRTPEQPS
jgi:hypothetical protein